MNLDNEIDYIVSLIYSGDFSFVSTLLDKSCDIIKETDTEILLTLLVASSPAKSKIESRPLFYKMVKEEFQERHPDRWETLLEGLE